MPNDVLERLSRANPVPDDLPAPPIEPLLDRLEGVPTRLATRRLSVRALAGLAAAMLVAVTVAVAAGALILLGGHKRSTADSAAPPGRQQLIDIIGALRRPQTKADLKLNILSRLKNRPLLALQGQPDLPLVRLATTTPWGEKLYFVPMKPPTANQLNNIAGPHVPAILIGRPRGETLGLFSSQGGGGGGDAPSIEAGQGMHIDGAGRSFAGGSTETRFILVVPDGVASVEFVLPRQPQPGMPGAPTYAHSLSVAVPVHHNVAAVQVNRECCGGPVPMIWYAANGAVIKRIGNLAEVNRLVPPPRPGPETALSRAAERNPSTPNRVWVTPPAGRPHTNFMVHFRVLLNDADYSYRLSGTSCPTITVSGGGGGGPQDLRGRIWSDTIGAVQGQSWCPGIYHLSVSVMDLGRYGMLKHPAAPFGDATFTVGR